MVQIMKRGAIALGAILLAAGTSRAAIVVNEHFADPPNRPSPTGENGQEFFELLNTSGGAVSLDGVWLLQVEGDGNVAGTIDRAINLSAHSTGSNGLFLWRDNTETLLPAPAPETVVHVEDFNPDFENLSVTLMVVRGFTGNVGDDLDTNNDGVLDSTPWTSVDDAVGFRDLTTDQTYSAGFGPSFTEGATSISNIQAYLRTPDGVGVAVNVTDNPLGPYEVTTSSSPLPDGYTLTPGSPNPPIPEPAALSLLGVAGLAALRRRRRA